MKKIQIQNLAYFLALASLTVSGPVWGDRVVSAIEVVVLSDDIYKTTTEVIHAGEEGDEGGLYNRSGLGDGTNPGQGKGRGNASNTGRDNPHNAR